MSRREDVRLFNPPNPGNSARMKALFDERNWNERVIG